MQAPLLPQHPRGQFNRAQLGQLLFAQRARGRIEPVGGLGITAFVRPEILRVKHVSQNRLARVETVAAQLRDVALVGKLPDAPLADPDKFGKLARG